MQATTAATADRASSRLIRLLKEYAVRANSVERLAAFYGVTVLNGETFPWEQPAVLAKTQALLSEYIQHSEDWAVRKSYVQSLDNLPLFVQFCEAMDIQFLPQKESGNVFSDRQLPLATRVFVSHDYPRLYGETTAVDFWDDDKRVVQLIFRLPAKNGSVTMLLEGVPHHIGLKPREKAALGPVLNAAPITLWADRLLTLPSVLSGRTLYMVTPKEKQYTD